MATAYYEVPPSGPEPISLERGRIGFSGCGKNTDRIPVVLPCLYPHLLKSVSFEYEQEIHYHPTGHKNGSCALGLKRVSERLSGKSV